MRSEVDSERIFYSLKEKKSRDIPAATTAYPCLLSHLGDLTGACHTPPTPSTNIRRFWSSHKLFPKKDGFFYKLFLQRIVYQGTSFCIFLLLL